MSRVPLLENLQYCALRALIPMSTSQLNGSQQKNSTFQTPPHRLGHSRPSRYLYYRSFGIDACFRFKRQQISSYEKDPELGPGFAYIVAWEPYQHYLLKHGNQSEVNDFPFVLGLHLTTVCRSARVLACLHLSTQIQSSPRVTQLLVLCARHAATNLFSQKGLANFKKEKGSHQSLPTRVFPA